MHKRSFPLAVALSAVLGAAEPTKEFHTVEELWSGFDPRALSLAAKVVKETASDGLVLRTVLYTSEISEGFTVRVIAYYGYPAGQTKLPAIMHVHGGGQNATLAYVKYWAQRGY